MEERAPRSRVAAPLPGEAAAAYQQPEVTLLLLRLPAAAGGDGLTDEAGTGAAGGAASKTSWKERMEQSMEDDSDDAFDDFEVR